MTPRILLVGMMRAGKTTTGHLLAERPGWGYGGSNTDVESATGLTVPEFFARDGEAASATPRPRCWPSPAPIRRHRSSRWPAGPC